MINLLFKKYSRAILFIFLASFLAFTVLSSCSKVHNYGGAKTLRKGKAKKARAANQF